MNAATSDASLLCSGQVQEKRVKWSRRWAMYRYLPSGFLSNETRSICTLCKNPLETIGLAETGAGKLFRVQHDVHLATYSSTNLRGIYAY
jgi:hypothetical protein